MAPQPCSKCGEVKASIQVDAKGRMQVIVCKTCWKNWLKSPQRQAVLSTLDMYFKLPPKAQTPEEWEQEQLAKMSISKRRKGMRSING